MPADSRSDPGRRGRPRSTASERLAGALRRSPRAVVETWRLLGREQRVAAAGAVGLGISTLGRFAWLEAAQLLVAASVLLLLKQRADGAVFHLPFGDGVVVAVSGAWAALLVLLRVFDRPLGQGLLALACAGLLVAAGLREHARRPADDLPERRQSWNRA